MPTETYTHKLKSGRIPGNFILPWKQTSHQFDFIAPCRKPCHKCTRREIQSSTHDAECMRQDPQTFFGRIFMEKKFQGLFSTPPPFFKMKLKTKEARNEKKKTSNLSPPPRSFIWFLIKTCGVTNMVLVAVATRRCVSVEGS